jgi:hypothetical protein
MSDSKNNDCVLRRTASGLFGLFSLIGRASRFQSTR